MMPKTASPTIASFAADYLVLRAPDLNPRTLKNYTSLLALHIVPTLGTKRLDAVTTHDIMKWRASMLAKSGPVNTRNAYAVLRSVFTLAMDGDLNVKANPCRIRTASRDLSKPRPEFTIQDFRAVREWMPERYRLPLDVVVGSALRISELPALNWGSWHPETGKLDVFEQVKDGSLTALKTGVQGRASIYPMKPAVEALEAMRDLRRPWSSDDEPIFPGERVQRLSVVKLREEWGKARKMAKRPDMRLHDLRHLGISIFARSGANLRELMNFSRHRDQKAVMRYMHSEDEERARELSRRASEAWS